MLTIMTTQNDCAEQAEWKHFALGFFKIEAIHSEKENLTDGEECEVELTAYVSTLKTRLGLDTSHDKGAEMVHDCAPLTVSSEISPNIYTFTTLSHLPIFLFFPSALWFTIFFKIASPFDIFFFFFLMSPI